MTTSFVVVVNAVRTDSDSSHTPHLCFPACFSEMNNKMQYMKMKICEKYFPVEWHLLTAVFFAVKK